MRLIDADAAIEAMSNVTVLDKSAARRILTQLPTIEAVPVVHGRWIPWKKWNEGFVVCSECKLIGYKNYDALRPGYASNMNYCPNCGASMTEGAEE